MTQDGSRTIAVNRRARHDYEVLESLEAGLVLTGSEIKSVRAGKVQIAEAYAQERRGELWLQNLHVSEWPGAGPWGQHDPRRPKKLLLRKEQIRRLGLLAAQQRLTMVPLKLYIKGHRAKVEIALVRGMRKYDRRDVIAKRDAEREMQRASRRRA
ncbi:MAG: SsrA-binding protein SmpB [SAR202 cluster bacterium]|nr:SsrA-binding protein SmpB [SAR202 cluster bacterium]